MVGAGKGDVATTESGRARLAGIEISSPLRVRIIPLSVHIDEEAFPASGSGRIKKVMGDCGEFDRMAPGPSGERLPAGACCRIPLGILYGGCVDVIWAALAGRRRRPSESVGGGNNTNRTGPRGERSRSKRHEAGRHIGRVDRIHRRRKQFNRHGRLVCQLLIYRQFRPEQKDTVVL